MKVIIFNDYAKITGGQDQCALAGAKGLARREIDVTLYTAVGPVMPDLLSEPNLKTICLDQVDILNASSRLRAMVDGFRNKAAIEDLAERLKGLDPSDTILHFHSYTKAFSPAFLKFAIDKGFKVVMTLNDYFIECPNGAFFVFPEEKICKRTPLSIDCITCNCDSRSYGHKLWRSVRTAYQNKVLKLDAGICRYVSVSKFCADILRKDLPKSARIDFLFNPIDLPNDGPAPVDSNKPFLFVGRFVETKGVHLFAEAIKRLGYPAVFVGDGPLKEEMARKCPDAQFTGWLPAAEVRKLMRQSRCLVFPSMWYEAQPLTPAESLANGVPVITSDCNAAVDYVLHNKNGLQFKNGDIEDLCQQMEKMSDPAFAKEKGAAAYDGYWVEPWSLENHTSRLIKIYEDVLKN